MMDVTARRRLGASTRIAGLAAAAVLAWALVEARTGEGSEPGIEAQLGAEADTKEHRERVERAVAQRLLAERRIGEMLDDFHDAAADADFERYFGHMTEDSVFLGTDATERWVGEQFRAFAKPHFGAGQGWTYRPRERRIDISAAGDVAWFDELLENEKLGTCRGSGVVVRDGDVWRVAQYNLSIPIPNDLAGQVVQIVRDGEPAPDAPAE